MRIIENHSNYISKKFESSIMSIIGLGHANALVGTALAKYGVRFYLLYDRDDVEEKNLSGSLYSIKNVGEEKTSAYAKQILNQFPFNPEVMPYQLHLFSRNFTLDEVPFKSDVVIVGTDNGRSRYEIFRAHQKREFQNLYIDIRVDFNYAEIYFVPFNDKKAVEQYENNLELIKNTEERHRCGERHLFQTILQIASVVTAGINAYFLKQFEGFNRCSIDAINRKEAWLQSIGDKDYEYM
ncbi:MAG: ThiF family adenylyltransferase [Candidatus Nanoarchaeia archaeon]